MIQLIVEGGSTKADWIAIDHHSGQKQWQTQTPGINPFYSTESQILETLGQNQRLQSLKQSEVVLYFYGAGCHQREKKVWMTRVLNQFFGKAERISIHQDLDAAAFSTYREKPNLTCILGTGTNACYFDGESVQQTLPSLGYLLGDEGSGNYIGRQLLHSYYYGLLPSDLAQLFEQSPHASDLPQVLEQLYEKQRPSAYLASLAPFVYEHRAHPFFRKMLLDGFQKFLDYFVLSYPNAKELEINFIGSIGFYFEPEIRLALEQNALTAGVFIQRPLEQLVEYHRKYHLK